MSLEWQSRLVIMLACLVDDSHQSSSTVGVYEKESVAS